MQYLAGFETEQGDVCQGLVHFPASPRLQTFYPERWFETVARFATAFAGVTDGQVSLRTSLRAGRLEQLALFRAPAAQEKALRHYITEYLGLISLVPGSVALPLDARDHDNLAQPWTPHLCRVPVLTYPDTPQVGEDWFSCDFRVHDFLPQLLDEAAAAGHEMLHQINFQSWPLTSDHSRAAKRNYVALNKLRGRGPSNVLLALQERILSRPEGQVLLVSEDVGASSAAGADWLKQALARHFARLYGAMKFDQPTFAFSAPGGKFNQFLRNSSPEAEEMAYGFHPALIEAPATEKIFASAVTRDKIHEAFDWAGRLRRWFEPALVAEQNALRQNYQRTEEVEKREESAVANALAVRPLEISSSVSDYAFISYRRSDFSRIEPILEALNAARVPFWFDRGLLGGEQWMSRLQERIYNARSFLLFLSKDSVESRYVQMEVHFAHHIDRPHIVPVQLEQVDPQEMPGGLGMVLAPKNMIPPDQMKIIALLNGKPPARS